ncbi:hypothetical protein REPUB_Repub17cG0064300 [Reevesia pubescens]
MPGALVVGDYVIENGDWLAAERGNDRGEVPLGENLLGLQDDDEEDDLRILGDAGEEASSNPRRRRRLMRSRSDEDQS